MSHAAPSAPSAPSAPARSRIDSIDVVRGLIMIIMALDHTRDYFGNAAVSPTNLAQASAALFLTRWITNICAPVFFLLTGTGAYLALQHRTPAQLSRYLATRGLWLIVVEITLARFLWQFNVDYRLTMLTVLWALGWSMIALAAMVRLPVRMTATIGAILIVVHNLFDGASADRLGRFALIGKLLHVPSVLVANPAHTIFEAYPLIPWIGVTAVGFGLGALFSWNPARRRAMLGQLGLGLTAAFALLRFANIYGDPSRWNPQRTFAFTVLSFLNTAKYPPSLLFLLMTLGPALLLLAAVDSRTPRLLRPALVIGRVPFFYYLVHIAVIHLLAIAVCYARYGAIHWMFESPTLDRFPITQPPGWPLDLPFVYAAWITVVVLAYPLCRWFAALRARRTDWWLRYL